MSRPRRAVSSIVMPWPGRAASGHVGPFRIRIRLVKLGSVALGWGGLGVGFYLNERFLYEQGRGASI